MHTYHEVTPITKEAAEVIFASNDVSKICEAMVGVAYYEEDWKWAQDKFLEFFRDSNLTISALAATCLGHVARIHRTLERKKVIEALKSRANEKEIAGIIEDALNDIEMFA